MNVNALSPWIASSISNILLYFGKSLILEEEDIHFQIHIRDNKTICSWGGDVIREDLIQYTYIWSWFVLTEEDNRRYFLLSCGNEKTIFFSCDKEFTLLVAVWFLPFDCCLLTGGTVTCIVVPSGSGKRTPEHLRMDTFNFLWYFVKLVFAVTLTSKERVLEDKKIYILKATVRGTVICKCNFS